ncbi:MAG: hypothetical protein AB7O62_00550 [Pirellulales bacterium]
MSAVQHGPALLQRINIVQRCAMLAGVVLVACLVALPVALRLSGSQGAVACCVAAAICCACSTVALVLTARGQGPNAALKGLLYSMFFQMGIPLLCGIALYQSGSALAAGGVFGWIVVFHLITLAAKTLLVLPLVNPGKSSISQGA